MDTTIAEITDRGAEARSEFDLFCIAAADEAEASIDSGDSHWISWSTFKAERAEKLRQLSERQSI